MMMFVTTGLAVMISMVASHVCDFRYDYTYKGWFADCRGRKLHYIPNDMPLDIVSLDLSLNEIPPILKKFSFRRYYNLVYLNVGNNHLLGIESEAFTGLIHLNTLLCDGNYFGILTSLNMLKPLIGRNMTKLDLSRIHAAATYKSTTLKIMKENTKYLTQICVKEFLYRKNYVAFIEDDALFGEPFASCVEILDLSQNILIGNVKLILQVSRFTRLKRLTLGNQRLVRDLNSESLFPNLLGTYEISLPSSLEYLDVSTLVKFNKKEEGCVISFLHGKCLKTFIFAYTQLPFYITMQGLDQVETFDLSGTNLHSVRYSFFKTFRNVKRLSVHNCNLRFMKDTQLIFSQMPMLQSLDISKNYITEFPILANPSFLIELNLSGNGFDSIPSSLLTFTNLTTFDMSYNSIRHIGHYSQSVLNELHLNTKLSLSLHGNIFSCGCQNLDFVIWLTESPVIFESDRNFSCILDDGSMTGAVEVARNIVSMTRHCNGKLSLTITIIFVCVLLSILVGIYIIAKNPVRYQNVVLRYIGFKVLQLTPDDFPYKFYVGYCEADMQFVYQNLRRALELCYNPVCLFLKDREVLPGVDIADGIVEGINNSWKTILVASQDFLGDPWSNFTINTAVYSMTDLIPDRIIILLVDDVQVKDLSGCLLNAVDEEFIFHINETDPQKLWRRLQVIKELF